MSSSEGDQAPSQPDPQLNLERSTECPNQSTETDSLTRPLATSQSSGSSGEDINQYAHDYVIRKCAQGDTIPEGDDEVGRKGNPSSIVAESPSKPPARVCCDEVSVGSLADPEILKTPEQPPARTSLVHKAVIHDLFDSDSDVLSLGECIKVSEPAHSFDDTQEKRIAAAGESCFTVLHGTPQATEPLFGLRTGTSDAEQSGTEGKRTEIGLHSVDPYPQLMRPAVLC